MEELIIICPHCSINIIIEQLNCGIFRHGCLKTTGLQIEPHSTKQKCEQLKNDDLIYGCGKPFKIFKDISNQLIVEKCDYI
jgi:hypothetical protein